MVIKSVNLETVCGITSTFPDNPHYEVAFAGKSNVGKSSLINALMNRKALARTSSQPGKTQTINFYNVNDAMYLVDLPGYGYANANVEIKAKWGKMIEKYLHTSSKLKAVFLLIDIRHEPSDNDCLMYEWMVEQGFAPIIIATKMDKISRGAVPKHMQMIADTLKVEPDTIMIPFSAETKQGREEIWELIDSLVLVDEGAEPGVASGEENVQVSKDGAENSVQEAIEPVKQRKPRWKAEGKETAKKTKKLQEKKAVKNAAKKSSNKATAKTPVKTGAKRK
jgi:GTP-binding protein